MAELDRKAAAYDDGRSPFGVKDILKLIGPSDQVLDAGCGTGHHTKAIAGVARSVVGIDTDAGRISIAGNTCRGLTNASFQVASVTDMRFAADDSFDVVVIVQVLHHLAGDDVIDVQLLRQQCQKCIAEAKRVLRSRGRMILVTTSREQRRTAYWHFNLFPESAWKRLEGVWTLSEGEWFKSLMESHGFHQTAAISPSESHWTEFEGVDMVKSSLDPDWRSTDVAFDLLTPGELEQFVERAESSLKDGSALKLVQDAHAGRESVGEASVYLYEKR